MQARCLALAWLIVCTSTLARADERVVVRLADDVPGTETAGDDLPTLEDIAPPRRVSNDEGASSTEAGLREAFGEAAETRPGFNLYTTDTFQNAFRIPDTDVFIKPGGYVKADFIHDFDAIGSTDNFVTSTISASGPSRTNTRFHARQTRFNLDVRWDSEYVGPVKVFVEGDFFSEADRFRLRHAYGTTGRFLAGQTWTTFTDVNSLPTTLDLESSVSSVTRRQAQLRYKHPTPIEGLTFAIAVEDPSNLIVVPPGVDGESRTPLPDLVTRVRYERDDAYGFQLALVIRQLGFQPVGMEVVTETAWGLNFSGHIRLSDRDNAVFQVVGGEGIGSFWGIPDVAPSGSLTAELLPMSAWMVGLAHNWTDNLATNVTFSRSQIDNTAFQLPDELHETQYFAVNLIWYPIDNLYVGVELLYGTRVDVDRDAGSAKRLQFAAAWLLP